MRSGGEPVEPHDPRFTLQDLLRVGTAEPRLLPKVLRAVTLLDTPDAIAQDPLFVETLATVRVERAAKRATRRAQGRHPAVQRADLLLAGVG